MHFTGTFSVALLLFCCCAGYLYLTLGSHDDIDRLDYERVMSDQGSSGTAYTSRQQRIGLQKDVLLAEGGRLRLQSASAELELDYHDSQTHAVEHMQDAVCYMQEEFFYRLPDGRKAVMHPDGRFLFKHTDANDPAGWDRADYTGAQPMQIVRKVQAGTACYRYNNDLFTANDVVFSRYIASGHDIEQAAEQLEPLMGGSAAALEFTTGQTVVLSGNACIEYGLGRFSADKMILHMPHEKESAPFGFLQMCGHVNLAFKEGGLLSCSHADLDSSSLSGSFLGSPEQEEVVYTELLQDRKNEGSEFVPLMIKSRKMSVNLSCNSAKAEGRSRHHISKMTAEDHVTINYNREFAASADLAVYSCHNQLEKQSGSLPGTIVMRSNETGMRCYVSHQNGDCITASEIRMDTVAKKFTFLDPEGSLRTADEKGAAKAGMEFSAGILVWDDASRVLSLKDHVVVNQKAFGKMETSTEVRLYRAKDSKTLKAIETAGETVLTYCDKEGSLSHTLICSGPVKTDHVKLETRLYAECDAQGVVLENKQLLFEDVYGKIYADKALVKYAMAGQAPAIRKIILAGNVRIINHQYRDGEAEVLQHALADRVDYIPESKEMIFKSLSPDHRALFYDKANNLQVSAPALKVTRDQASGRDTVHGMGDVRFSFMESEFQQLRQRFLLEKPEFTGKEN